MKYEECGVLFAVACVAALWGKGRGGEGKGGKGEGEEDWGGEEGNESLQPNLCFFVTRGH